jgi:squalene-hopene/tetraprenyl-beta-curcumene cyclase
MPSETLADNRVLLADQQLEDQLQRARAALARVAEPDGHFVFELEADATIPAEYVMLEHFLDRIEAELQRRIGVYLRELQGAHGGWPLFHDGAFDLSASVKAYYALKLIGDPIEAPHMVRARQAILAAGGAERCNVFTRAQLALFGQVPWDAVPVMPPELMLAPRWFPINLDRVSYWSRTVIVPLLVLMTRKPRARNPRGVGIAELFRRPPEEIRDWIRGPYRSIWGHVFRRLDSLLRAAERLAPQRLRKLAIQRAVDFVIPRLNGEDGLGGIYPAMANTVMMFDTLGYGADHPHAVTAWSAVRKLLVVQEDRAYCQPCLSPVWDTSLAGHALAEASDAAAPDVEAACRWLRARQITDRVGDWAAARPHLPPGGWAFQYENAYYPDVDDTAVVAMLLARNGDPQHAAAIRRAAAWIIGMQCRDGGWGAFDADNDYEYLNHIPFADHGALLDPPTADVTARCLSFLAQIGHAAAEPFMAKGIGWLLRQQEADGSWFGRWGTNYIYGTWSVLCALNAVGLPHEAPSIRRAVGFLLETQREDGGWGEDEDSYRDGPRGRYHCSTPSQTSWALLGLMAGGEVDHPAVERGITYLLATQRPDGEWDELPYTAVGFPRVFYLRYHGYRLFFPLLAMARFRNLKRGNVSRVAYGF